jgi:formylglycine-generating enzyme required for sulfatase activity
VPVLFLSSRQGRLFRWRPSFLLVVILALILGLRFFGYPEWQSKATVLETIGQRCPPVEGLDMEFVRIPPGSFSMGSTKGNEGPPHEVEISRPFCLGVYEVTQKQWEVVMGPNTVKGKQPGDDLPVTSVTWDQVQDFLSQVNHRAGRRVVRLPMEAEWEYAARGPGGKSAGGNCLYDDPYDGLAPAGAFQTNQWGLYDMYGNVWEWVSDWEGPYPNESVRDPTGPKDGTRRVKRGGSFRAADEHCRPARRSSDKPGSRENDLGFRVLRELDAGPASQSAENPQGRLSGGF